MVLCDDLFAPLSDNLPQQKGIKMKRFIFIVLTAVMVVITYLLANSWNHDYIQQGPRLTFMASNGEVFIVKNGAQLEAASCHPFKLIRSNRIYPSEVGELPLAMQCEEYDQSTIPDAQGSWKLTSGYTVYFRITSAEAAEVVWPLTDDSIFFHWLVAISIFIVAEAILYYFLVNRFIVF